jgi:hypothetical protein
MVGYDYVTCDATVPVVKYEKVHDGLWQPTELDYII